jgi:DNA-binding protein HU-beta
MSITKQELIDIIATKTQTTKKTVETCLDAYNEAVIEAIKKGLSVQLIGFGTFKVRTRAARKGRNPQTGEALDIPAKTVPVFRPGTKMKEAAAKAK